LLESGVDKINISRVFADKKQGHGGEEQTFRHFLRVTRPYDFMEIIQS